MKKSIIALIIFSVFCTGCSKDTNLSVITKPSKDSRSINRYYEDLTLGMSEDELKSKLVYHSPRSPHGEPYVLYTVYDNLYNVYEAGKDPISGEYRPRMKEIENIFRVYVTFFEGKLLKYDIEYKNNYHPGWSNFIYNAKEKYGKGKESSNRIMWDDGGTTLIITKEFGDQLPSPDGSVSDYGEHYVASYIDNVMFAKMDKKQKEMAPSF